MKNIHNNENKFNFYFKATNATAKCICDFMPPILVPNSYLSDIIPDPSDLYL